MKPFESFLAPLIEQYIVYRQGLGYRDANIRYLLFPLDHYVKDRQAHWESFTPNFFLDLRGKLKQEPKTINRIMTGMRGFFHFLHRQVRAWTPQEFIFLPVRWLCCRPVVLVDYRGAGA